MKVMIVDDERDVEFLFRQRFRKEVKEGFRQVSDRAKSVADQIGALVASSDHSLAVQKDILGKLGSLDVYASGIHEEVKSLKLLGSRQIEAFSKCNAELSILKDTSASAAQSLEKAIR